jgi:hypothetical protein
MKNIYIIHGWDGNPKEPMLEWLKINLEKDGNQITVPEMPEAGTPKIEAWIRKLQEIIKPNSETILVGHSIGCQAILRYLETLAENIKIAGIVLMAPWMELDKQTMEDEGQEGIEIARPWMETPIDFKKVRTHIGKAIAIFSDNDSYVPLSQKDLFERELGAEIIVEHNMGHFTVGEGINELPSALDVIKSL